MLDVDDLVSTRLGLLDDDLDYTQALEAGAKRLGSLPPAKLSVEIEIDGKVYQVVTCKAGVDTNIRRLSEVRFRSGIVLRPPMADCFCAPPMVEYMASLAENTNDYEAGNEQ